jgi:hypothetical protein
LATFVEIGRAPAYRPVPPNGFLSKFGEEESREAASEVSPHLQFDKFAALQAGRIKSVSPSRRQ